MYQLSDLNVIYNVIRDLTFSINIQKDDELNTLSNCMKLIRNSCKYRDTRIGQ